MAADQVSSHCTQAISFVINSIFSSIIALFACAPAAIQSLNVRSTVGEVVVYLVFVIYQQRAQEQDIQPPRSEIPPAIYDGSAPVLSSRRLTQVSRACIIASGGFYVVNCDTTGPQVNICWRVPGPRNIWLARLAASPDGSNTNRPPSIVPGMTLSCFRRGPSGGECAWSIIMAKSCGDVEERIGRGEGELIFDEPISEESLVAFGRAVGIEVLCVRE
ncbi:hypothetical protein CEK25_006766 [Fusarium fujikuroi]|nr:hypothetical protein CEK25_006766 [Fusarium fujikuroi]